MACRARPSMASEVACLTAWGSIFAGRASGGRGPASTRNPAAVPAISPGTGTRRAGPHAVRLSAELELLAPRHRRRVPEVHRAGE